MKKRPLPALVAAATIALPTLALAQAQDTQPKGIIVPPPQHPAPTPRLHLPLFIFIPSDNRTPSTPNGETPASIACIYGVTAPTPGCPKNGAVLPDGGTKAIAVVEYGQYSAVQSDINTFSAQWGLPNVTLTQICSPGPSCPNNAGTQWDLETALDVQWAHAMAPHAQIIISSFTNDPLDDGAETAAANAVAAAGGGEVSNSWTYGGEDSSELSLDSFFVKPGVVFFVSADDAGLGAVYPSVSPNVISAGGTHVARDSNGNFTGESCWSGSGGGFSQYEPVPDYQITLKALPDPHRGTPDLAAVADPQPESLFTAVRSAMAGALWVALACPRRSWRALSMAPAVSWTRPTPSSRRPTPTLALASAAITSIFVISPPEAMVRPRSWAGISAPVLAAR
jgi:hypothetical protein